MTATLTLPAHVAVLLFERQPVLSAAESVYGTPSGTVPLTSWATFDRLPDVECSTCGGTGWIVAGQTHGQPEGEQAQCPADCTSGRRPLRAGDRVEIVAGELPKHLSEHGDWLAWTATTGVPTPPALLSVGEPILLPEPGTVLGTAVVDWAGPIHTPEQPCDLDSCVVNYGNGIVFFKGREAGVEITDHDHLDWTSGRECENCEGEWEPVGPAEAQECPVCNGSGPARRFAVKFTEAVKA